MCPYDFFLRFKGVIFDLDGTLVNSMPLHLKAWRQALAPFKVQPTDEFFLSHGGVPSSKIASLLINQYGLTNTSQLELTKAKNQNYISSLSSVELFVDIVPLLEYLKAHNILMAIGTGTTRYNMTHILKHTVLHKFISCGICAEDVVNHKPAPDTFLEAALHLETLPQESLVVEDTLLGIEAALKGGFYALLVHRGNFVKLLDPNGNVLKTWDS